MILMSILLVFTFSMLAGCGTKDGRKAADETKKSTDDKAVEDNATEDNAADKKDKDKKEPGLELSSPGIYIDKLLYGLGCNKRLYSKSSFIISIALTNEGFRGFITLK